MISEWNGNPIIISPPYRLLWEERILVESELVESGSEVTNLQIHIPVAKKEGRRDIRVIAVEVPYDGGK